MKELKEYLLNNIEKISFKMIGEEGEWGLSLDELDSAIENLREDEALKVLQKLQNKKVAHFQIEDDYVYILEIK